MNRFSGLPCATLLIAGTVILSGQQRLPIEPFRQFGSSVTPAFEGWFENPDGTRSFLIGYLNRNSQQSLDVAIGPDNRIEPGGPDMGQPTHFLPGRQFGMFLITVPKDFTAEQRLTWTISANGQPMSVPFRLTPDYVVSPFTDIAVGNKPPILRFEEKGASFQGPRATVAKATSLTATMSAPLALNVWASDDAKYTSGTNAPLRTETPPVTMVWSKYRGPGTVTFEKTSPPFEKLTGAAAFDGRAATPARYSEPGEDLRHVTGNELSGPGGGGEVCCWTTGLVKVTVKQ
jgi:hypothetical protein